MTSQTLAKSTHRFGPFMNRTFLIVVDAHSKWPEVIEMHPTTAQKTIMELHKLFATYGVDEVQSQ